MIIIISIIKRTLVIAPHADDEVIGCGGIISKLVQSYGSIVHIVIGAVGKYYSYSLGRDVEPKERVEELQDAIMILGGNNNQNISYEVMTDKESRMDQIPIVEIVTRLDQVLQIFKPELVLFPYPSHHQDHQVMYNASIAALRPNPYNPSVHYKMIYEYPYYDSWNFNRVSGGKIYLDIKDQLDTKIKALNAYKSQTVRDPADLLHEDTIKALAKMRGREVGLEAAEAYYLMTGIIFKNDIYE